MKFVIVRSQNAIDADFGSVEGLSRERRGGSEGRRVSGIQRIGSGPSGPARGCRRREQTSGGEAGPERDGEPVGA
jgi:hypothetical protein